MNSADHVVLMDGRRAQELLESGGWAWFVREVRDQLERFTERLIHGDGGVPGVESDTEIRARYRQLEAILTWPQIAVEAAEATKQEIELERA